MCEPRFLLTHIWSSIAFYSVSASSVRQFFRLMISSCISVFHVFLFAQQQEDFSMLFAHS